MEPLVVPKRQGLSYWREMKSPQPWWTRGLTASLCDPRRARLDQHATTKPGTGWMVLCVIASDAFNIVQASTAHVLCSSLRYGCYLSREAGLILTFMGRQDWLNDP